MSKQDKDTDERYISELYSALSNESTPEELDRKILSEARHAVKKDDEEPSAGFTPTNRRGSILGQWGAPVSLAAVVVLSVTVVVTIEKERPYDLASPPVRTSVIEKPEESQHKALVENEQHHLLRNIQKQAKKQAVREPAKDQREIQKSSKRVAVVENETKTRIALAKKAETTKPADISALREKSIAESGAGQRGLTRERDSQADSGRKEPSVEKRSVAALAPAPAIVKRKAKVSPPQLQALAVPTPEKEASEYRVAEERAVAQVTTESQSDEVAGSAGKSPLEQAAAPLQEAEQRDDLDQGEVAAAEPAEKQIEITGVVSAAKRSIRSELASGRSMTRFAASADQLKKPQRPFEMQCYELAERDCMLSRQCVLELAEEGKYVCRANRNHCEDDFSQGADSEDGCMAKEGCRFLEANCFCLPGDSCVCDGGTPAACQSK